MCDRKSILLNANTTVLFQMSTYANFLCRSRSNCTIFWEENHRFHLCHLLAQKSSRLPPLPCQENQETSQNQGRIRDRTNLYFDNRKCKFVDYLESYNHKIIKQNNIILHRILIPDLGSKRSGILRTHKKAKMNFGFNITHKTSFK